MHFSIPEGQEVRGTEGTYLVYRVYVNGHFQAALRFRQLLVLHQQLSKYFKGLPQFPPKKLLSLSAAQAEERRIGLEKYIQQVVEIAGKSALFNGFFRCAQLESSGETLAKKEIHVFLPNGERFTFSVWNNSPTSALLQMVCCTQLKLKPNFVSSFALVVFRRESNGVWSVIRKLGEYESPYISLSWLSSDHRIVLRKWDWNQAIEEELMQDPVGLNLLYLQTACDIEAGWISIPKESLRTLCALESEGKKRDYLDIARNLRFYGTIKFSNCETSFPAPSTIVDIYVGYKELTFLTSSKDTIMFKITRIKSWRFTLHQDVDGPYKAELSFEFLQSKNLLKWISIESEHTLLINLCLQEIVTEMASKQYPTQYVTSGPSRASHFPNCYYLRRDGEHVPIKDELISSNSNSNSNSAISGLGSVAPSASSSSSSMSSAGGASSSHHIPRSNSLASSSGSAHFTARPSISKSFSTDSDKKQEQFLENSVFAGIGDDDL